MRQLYFDCSMGAAGDMLCASLLELFPDREEILARLNGLGIPHVHYEAVPTVKNGVAGTRLAVKIHGVEEGAEGHEHEHEHGHGHHHAGPTDIKRIVESLALSDAVRGHVLAVYESIAEAESRVHGVSVEEIHFHEVGSLDAVADVTAFCYLMDLLAPDRVTASPVRVGSGTVRCAHGILPVPAPAAALLLQGIPIYAGEIEGELCTPTGAALLKHYVNQFGPMPLLTPERIGYGMGKKDFPTANCVRAFWGADETGDLFSEEMTELSCDLDDMTAEAIGYACRVLRDAGAPEVFTSPIYMKKDRPGTLLTVLCRPEQRAAMTALLLRHTTTLGVREKAVRRCVLERGTVSVDTPWGSVRKKISRGWGITREKYEFDDLARIAKERGCSLEEVLAGLE